jgi:hypothetical protein
VVENPTKSNHSMRLFLQLNCHVSHLHCLMFRKVFLICVELAAGFRSMLSWLLTGLSNI